MNHYLMQNLKESTSRFLLIAAFVGLVTGLMACQNSTGDQSPRERISINDGWRFMKYESAEDADSLIYDVRPEIGEYDDSQDADTKPTEAQEVESSDKVLKPWIMPSGNDFIKDPAKRYERPDGNPGSDFPFVQADFDDSSWEAVTLPHDWAIEGPFFEGPDAEVTGGMGRLPSPGVAWYRKDLDIPASDAGKSIFLDIDGAMSYSMVWLNGNLVGGWPFGYASYRLDLTPYVEPGGENQLAIRLDNPPESSRWYPGGGLYRNVWLTKTEPVHVAQWGTYITTPEVSEKSATIDLEVTIDNDSDSDQTAVAETEVYELDEEGNRKGGAVAHFDPFETQVSANGSAKVSGSLVLENPKLWGPAPTQTPNMYEAVTTIKVNGEIVDQYETEFGIRTIEMDPERGVVVNGEHIHLKGVNLHHDLGALGAAFNTRAAERQLEVMQEMGVNAIRTAHNPPAPEQLELADRMGLLVIDESFDVWERKKTPLDFHLIFPDWHEQDLRALVRRDKNHPSVILWSTGNEVGEQYTGQDGADLAMKLRKIMKDEDPTRLTTASMNYAKPPMEFPDPVEVISLNYQGEGIRNDGEYSHLRDQGITTPPLYPSFKETYPDRVIVSSENAAAVSSRGTYLFPVVDAVSSPISPGKGGNPETGYVSAYELYTVDFGSSADKVFRSIDQHPYVAGGFVWSGWDYIGEPTPYYSSRSSYFGTVDLAGFKKDRFYIYQARWRPDHAMAHIFPHWNWPGREGEVTPVHVATSGDEAELFLNGESLGRKQKGEFEYRLRWDDVTYEPGELKVVAYKDGEKWAEDVVETTGKASVLNATADRNEIAADGKDLSFITVKVVDEEGRTVPVADNEITFSIEGPGEIVATDNGDPTNFTPFPSKTRKAFNGLALAIVRGIPGETGTITVTAEGEGVEGTTVEITTVD
ncbi:beta-galactosidase GalB [Gracilimonas mengyeensis]|uniref:Beta-galactosidase n=1 Tax=Gracilimonas mengyeensis TaxID=1302730 RepID=A0A521B0G8_9BACT|nr:beta-galactosidase GalB [Gracilimonas mengyeensis]SMO40566.1 beta-galactosidase [Gracilimonas mengyeensis]